jgi:15-hydroxyprostaglandin dehydrogenase (NAD)
VIRDLNMPSSDPVAIVTGGASGIGLACVQNLLNRGYKVCIADANKSAGAETLTSLSSHKDKIMFFPCDVSDYSQQQKLFATAFAWGGRRLDFAALNAGIDDRQSLYEGNETMKTEQVTVEGGEVEVPIELNVKTLRVDLDAVVQGVWLFKWFNRMSEKEKKGGKVVVTSSSAGI